MNRRGFLRSILPVAAGAVVAPTVLDEIWVPTRKIFLPPAGGWVSSVSAGQVWSVNTLGGFFYSRQLAAVLREQLTPLIRFREFGELPKIDPEHTWDVYSDFTVR